MLHVRDVELRMSRLRPPAPPVVSERWVGHRCVLSLEGEIDIADVSLLEQSIDAAVAAAATEVWIDLAPATFIDVICVNCLLREQRALRQLNRRFVVIAPADGQARRVLELTGAGRQLELYATRNGAHLGA
jgi:anti-anti-sigma factor